MAAYSGGTLGSQLITMVGSQVDTVTFDADLESVSVVNPPTNSDAVWWTNDGSTPSVGGTASFYCPAGAFDVQSVPTSGKTVVKIISSGTPVVRVQRG